MIELYLLEQFEAFARYGTLSRASKELHISQPALTRSMKKIETDLGISLFHRDKRKLTLNPAGEVVAEYARRILDNVREMEMRAVETDRRMRMITLGSCVCAAINHLVPLLTQNFRDKSILTEIAEDEVLIERLKNHSCQLAVLHQRPDDSSLYCQRYFSEQIYISLPKDHPLANQKMLSADDLKDLSILTYDVGFWVGLCRQKMPRTSFLIQTDPDTMEQLVIASSLPVFNSDRMLADGYVPPDSVSLKLDEPFAQADYYISCLDSEKSRYGAFFNAIRAELIHAS